MATATGKHVFLKICGVLPGSMLFAALVLWASDAAATRHSPFSGIPGDCRAGKISFADEMPAAGEFLVATGRMTDPRFRETVVLLIHCGRDGAVGLIVNRPTKVKLSALLPGVRELRGRSDTAFIGGPVGMKQLFMLVRSAAPPGESLPVLRGVYVSTSLRLLERVVREGAGREKFRLYAGYAGWATGQLERELSRDEWRIVRADAGTVFDAEPAKIWPDLIRRSSAIRVKGKAPDAAVRRQVAI